MRSNLEKKIKRCPQKRNRGELLDIFRDSLGVVFIYVKLFIKFVYIFLVRKAAVTHLPRRKVAFFRGFFVFVIIFSWLFFGWPQIWQNQDFPPDIEHAFALNKTANWNFNGNSTGWTPTNGSGTAVCGSSTSGSASSFSTFVYNGALSGQTAFGATTPATRGVIDRGMITQTFAVPGSGTVKAKGKLSYYGDGANWALPNTSWIRLDIYDSGNSTYVGNLFCVSFASNQSWTNASFGSDINLTGGTTYTIRVTMNAETKSNKDTSITLGVDNIVVNLAPVGLSAGAVAGSTNASLSWTASSAGSGANGLHATTPYKVYRDAGSPVSTFLANSTANSYTDSSTAGNTTYYYAVSDVDTASDESPLSAEASVLTNPDVPTALNFTSVQQISLRLNWTAPTGGAASYKVERCEGSACSDFSQIASGETNTYYDDSLLTCNTLYRYQVRATNASGDGAYSSIAEQTTAACGLSAAIEVRAQNYTTSVSSITFPEGDSGTTVSQPYNNVDGSGSPQTFGGAGVAKPVVTLYNGGASTLTIWYNITTFTNGIVSSENYLINNKAAACADASCINGTVTFDADTSTVGTIAAGAGNEKDFYLKIVLSTVAGKSGNSTLTILGETL